MKEGEKKLEELFLTAKKRLSYERPFSPMMPEALFYGEEAEDLFFYPQRQKKRRFKSRLGIERERIIKSDGISGQNLWGKRLKETGEDSVGKRQEVFSIGRGGQGEQNKKPTQQEGFGGHKGSRKDWDDVFQGHRKERTFQQRGKGEKKRDDSSVHKKKDDLAHEKKNEDMDFLVHDKKYWDNFFQKKPQRQWKEALEINRVKNVLFPEPQGKKMGPKRLVSDKRQRAKEIGLAKAPIGQKSFGEVGEKSYHEQKKRVLWDQRQGETIFSGPDISHIFPGKYFPPEKNVDAGPIKLEKNMLESMSNLSRDLDLEEKLYDILYEAVTQGAEGIFRD